MNTVDLCDAFWRISRGVWCWMARARRVANPSLSKNSPPWGMSLHETTLTDYVVLRLLEECYPVVRTFTFPPFLEAQTGADLEMWITDSRQWLGLRVQCKVLGSHDEFEELHYQQKNGQYQCDVLIQAAHKVRGCLPVYLLYLGPHSARLPPKGCRYPSRLRPSWYYPYWYYPYGLGNWWISAYHVQKLRPKKHLDDLWPYMVPWHCIVCYPYPADISLFDVWKVLRLVVFQQNEAVLEFTPSDEPPHYVELAMEGRLPDSVDELRSLLEGREMRHLIVTQVV